MYEFLYILFTSLSVVFFKNIVSFSPKKMIVSFKYIYLFIITFFEIWTFLK